jgi:HEAT repeat protein
MRRMSLGLIVLLIGLVSVDTVLPQGKDKKEPDKKDDKKKDDKKAPPKITDIGGKSLDEWIKDIPSKDRSKSAMAIETVLRFGPDQAKKAVPLIIVELRKHKPGIAILDMSVRINGAVALGAILSSLENPDEGELQEAVRLMTALLKDEQRIIKHRVTQALGQLGPRAKEAIPELIKTTIDFPTWQTRHAAVLALGTVAYDEKNGPSRKVLTALYSALTDSSSQVRLAALQALDRLDVPDIKTEKGTLEDKVQPLANKDPELVVRIKAHLLLFAIQPKLKSQRCAAIAGMLKHVEVPVRIEAVQALGNIGAEAKDQVPKLMDALDDKDQVVVLWTIWALGEIGPAASQAIPALEYIKKDEKNPLHKAAEDALDKIKAKPSR